MPFIDDPEAFVKSDEYWVLVRATFRQVLNEFDDQRVEALRNAVAAGTRDEHLLAYHREPLDVAAQAAGRTTVTDADVQAYLRLRTQLGWT